MLNAITTRLEIDVAQTTELDQAIQYAVQHHMPAVVIPPALVEQAMANRVARRGKFKLIVAVDWPKGENFGVLKLRGMTAEMMDVDGYEIMTSGGRSELDNVNETRMLSDFIRSHISPLKEVRFVLSASTRPIEEVVRIAGSTRGERPPAFLRTDHQLKLQVTKASPKTHAAIMDAVKKVYTGPLKISGNIDCVKTIAACCVGPGQFARFAVSLQQAAQILDDLRRQPDELRELLTAKPSKQPVDAGTGVTT